MDQYDIPVGAYWPDEIDRGLSASDIVVGSVLDPSQDTIEARSQLFKAQQTGLPIAVLVQQKIHATTLLEAQLSGHHFVFAEDLKTIHIVNLLTGTSIKKQPNYLH